jgi:hypothetical protein
MEESKVPGEKTTCLSKVIDKLYHILYLRTRYYNFRHWLQLLIDVKYQPSNIRNRKYSLCLSSVFIFVESISGQRPVDCDDIDSGRSGVYTIYPKGSADPMKIFCFMQADGGGWTVSK